MFDLKLIQAQNDQHKQSQLKPNTMKSNKTALDNFETFCIEKFNGPSNEIILQASEDGKKGIIALIQSWIYWNKNERKLASRSIRTMASPIKKMFHKQGVTIIREDELDFGKIQKEARGIMTADMIENLINHADKTRKVMYLLQSCSAMRIGEILQLKRKHLDTTKDRIQINLTASMTKASEARITFVSKECEKLLFPIIEDLEPEDLVFNTKSSTEEHAFRRIASLAGFNEKFETTNYSKINSHAIRAWSITRMNKLNEFGFGHVISGHGYYMKTYNRKTPEELLEDYIKAEEYLQVFNRVDETEELKSLRESQKQLKLDFERFTREVMNGNIRPDVLNGKRVIRYTSPGWAESE